jgi:hypothetical protein
MSLSTRKENDRSAIQRYMYTGRRNSNYPLVESRDVRQLLVNVILVEFVGWWGSGAEVGSRESLHGFLAGGESEDEIGRVGVSPLGKKN